MRFRDGHRRADPPALAPPDARAVAGNLAVFLVLLVSLRAVGIESSQVTWIEAFAGWSLARALQLIPLTPGGVGPVELGLTGILVGLGGGTRRWSPPSSSTALHGRADAAARAGDDRGLALAPARCDEEGVDAAAGNRPAGEGAEPQGRDVEALRGDFERLRERGVATTLAPAATAAARAGAPEPFEAPRAELASRGAARDGRPPADAVEPRPGLARLIGR